MTAASGTSWSSPLWVWFLAAFLLVQTCVLLALALSWMRQCLREQARERNASEALAVVRGLLQHPQAPPPPSKVLRLAFAIASVVRTSLSGDADRAARDQLGASLRPAIDTLLEPLTAESRLAWMPRPGAHERAQRVLTLAGALPSPRLLPDLLALVGSHCRRIACQAVLTLGRGGEVFAGAAIPLASTLREHEAPDRLITSWALKRLLVASPNMIPQLVRDPSPQIRRTAVAAAATAHEQSSEAEGSQLLTAIHSALGDFDGQVRIAACTALATIARPHSTSALTALLADPEPAVRHAAARALGTIADPNACAPLVERLQTADLEEREDILTALAAISDVPADQWVADASSGPAAARRAALMALSTRADLSLPLRITDRLDDPELSVRREAALAIGAIARRCRPRALPSQVPMRLLQRLEHEESRSTLAALTEALAFAGDHNTPSLLLQRISSSPAFLREQLLEAIAIIELTQ